MDLKALGITDYGQIGPRGFRRPYAPGPMELCFNDEVMQTARWPNAGQPLARIVKVIDPGPSMRENDDKQPEDVVRYDSTQGGVFTYEDDRPDRWANTGDVWVSGVFSWGFSDDTIRVASIDPGRNEIHTGGPAFYGILAHRPFCGWFALNAIEEIDVPGEYAVDRQRGVLYFYPPEPLDEARVQLSMLDGPLVALEGASHVVFERLILECSRGTGVHIERGSENQVRGCTLRNMGIMGVQFGKGVEPAEWFSESYTGPKVSRQLGSWHEHVWSNNDFVSEAGTHHGVVSCDIYNMGAGGVHLSGGDRVTLEPAGNYVLNCHLHHCGRLDAAYKCPIDLDGVGNRVAHCLINEHPNMAIYLQGNDQVIEYNEICRNALQVDDMAALYTGMDPTQLGTVIRGTFWHHNVSEISGNHTVVYFDSPGGHGATIEGNVFYANPCNWGQIMLNIGAQCFKVSNNVFVGAELGVRLSEFTGEMPVHGFGGVRGKLLQIIDLTTPPYSERYPCMTGYNTAGWYGPGKNTVAQNLAYDCGMLFTGHPVAEHNLVTDEDPGFANPERMDFRLSDDAAVYRQVPGFEPIRFKEIGLCRDEYRRALPLRLPEIMCDSGFLLPGSTVTIRPSRPGCEIRYTLDGREPTRRSPLYRGPIPLGPGITTVRARAYAKESSAQSPSNGRRLYCREPVDISAVSPDGWLESAHALRVEDVILDEEGRMGHCEGGDYVVFGPFDFGEERCAAVEAVVGIDPDYAGQKMHLRLDGTEGETVGTFTWQSTGGFHVYGTQRTPLKAFGGPHYLYLVFEGGAGICNLERFRFVPR